MKEEVTWDSHHITYNALNAMDLDVFALNVWIYISKGRRETSRMTVEMITMMVSSLRILWRSQP